MPDGRKLEMLADCRAYILALPERPDSLAGRCSDNRFLLLLAVSEVSEDVAFFAFLNDDDSTGGSPGGGRTGGLPDEAVG